MRWIPALLLLAACGTKNLDNRLSRLEIRMITAEQTIAELRAELQLAQAREEPMVADPMVAEMEAKALIAEAEEAMRHGDGPLAVAKLEEVERRLGHTSSAGRVKRLLEAARMIGTPAAPLKVDRWYQGHAALTDRPLTLVVFWEVWCPHCKRAMPEVQRTWETWGDRGLQVVGLTKRTRSATDEGILTYLSEKGITFPIGLENGESTRDYDVYGVPAAAVVRDGKVLWRGHPSSITDDMLGEWLGSR